MLSSLFRVLDAALGIHPPNPPEPPPPPDSWTGNTSSSEMLALYSELGEEMRALRTTEFSVATIFYAVIGFLIAGTFSVLATDSLSPNVKTAVVIATILSQVALYVPVHRRIAQDNNSYTHLLSRRRYLEHIWFWHGMPGRPSNSGFENSEPGYRLTQRMLASSVVIFSFSLASALIFTLQYPNTREDDCRKTSAQKVAPASFALGTVRNGLASSPLPASAPVSTPK